MTTLLQITWDASPEILRIGSIALRWYGLFWALSFYIGYEIMFRIFKKEGIPLQHVDKLLYIFAFGSIVGARLGHCFFYDASYYLQNPAEIIMIWKGGLASHGGVIGILLAVWYYQKKVSTKSFWWLIDRLVIPISLAAFFIRMGNLMNSEIYGTETSLSWGFIFVSRGEIVAKHPTQLYEAIPYLLLFLTLGWLYVKKGARLPEGFISGVFAFGMFTVRFLVEFVKEDQSAFEADMLLNMGQLLSIPLIIAGIARIAYSWPGKLPDTK
jgi:phosphatidylglycerol---prolipoprotein diacylglyceryl transferase